MKRERSNARSLTPHKHSARTKPRTLTERQVARLVTNLRLALLLAALESGDLAHFILPGPDTRHRTQQS
jgi:hypothetical protein